MFDNDEPILSREEMLATGDPDLIEMANEMTASTDESALPEQHATQSVEDDSASEHESAQHDDVDRETDVNADDDAGNDDDTPLGVSDKHGKRVLPYEELASTRQERDQYKQQLKSEQERLTALQAQHEKLTQQLELAQQQGIELPKLIQDQEITDEVIAELEDVSPEMAMIAKKMQYNERLQKQQAGEVQTAQQNVDSAHSDTGNSQHGYAQADVNAAIKATPGIDQILADPAAKEMAIAIERQLANSGRYDSLTDRYAEVVRRTGAAMGKNFLPKGVKTPPQNDTPDLPESISDMANASRTSLGGRNTDDMTDAEYEQHVANASLDELEKELGL